MTVDRRTVALGVAAAAAVTAAVLVTTIGRHSDGSPQRQAVATYIDRVNAIQNQLHVPLTRVLVAYRDFTSHGSSPSSSSELAAAAATLVKLDRRLAALPAPPEARKLRRLLLALVAQQAEITREVHLLAAFAPRFSTLLRSAHAASRELGSRLKAIVIPEAGTLHGTRPAVAKAQREYQTKARAAAAAQADAIGEYDRAIAAVVRRMRLLHAPAALAATDSVELAGLTHTVEAGARLSAELRKANRADVAALGRDFTLASRASSTIAAQKAEISDIRAYNTRATALRTAAGHVQSELARLQRTLP